MTELPIDENTPRILIVEDEPKLGQLLIDYLRAASYAPTLINHGDKVLPYVRQTPPDLILLDLMLPGTDGLTLCREIRRFSDIPIVMVTAKIEEIDGLLEFALRFTAAQNGFHAGHDFAWAVRLTDIIIGADFQPQQPVDLFDFGRDHHNGDVGKTANLPA